MAVLGRVENSRANCPQRVGLRPCHRRYQAAGLTRIQRDDERIVYHLGKALYEDRRVDDALYAEAVSTLGEPAVIELTGVFGYYALVAMALNVFAVLRNVAAPLPFS